MENASKALIIAGSVLIAMLVLSILVWGWNRVSKYYQAEENVESVQQLYQKNKELESYNKQIIRGYELRSLYNLMSDMNERYSEEKGFKPITAKIQLNKNGDIIGYIKDVDYKFESDTVKENKTKYLWNTKSDLKTFMNEFFFRTGREKDFLKIFNESYFKCDKVIYNGELSDEAGNGTGRVQSFEFSERIK